jgi:hypothetical protein
MLYRELPLVGGTDELWTEKRELVDGRLTASWAYATAVIGMHEISAKQIFEVCRQLRDQAKLSVAGGDFVALVSGAGDQDESDGWPYYVLRRAAYAKGAHFQSFIVSGTDTYGRLAHPYKTRSKEDKVGSLGRSTSLRLSTLILPSGLENRPDISGYGTVGAREHRVMETVAGALAQTVVQGIELVLNGQRAGQEAPDYL